MPLLMRDIPRQKTEAEASRWLHEVGLEVIATNCVIKKVGAFGNYVRVPKAHLRLGHRWHLDCIIDHRAENFRGLGPQAPTASPWETREGRALCLNDIRRRPGASSSL